MSLEHEWTVRFGDVDLAGVIYYPGLFDRFVRTVEDAMAAAGYPFATMLEDAVGMPIVHAEADLHRPIRLGETVTIAVTPTVGETSVRFAFECTVDGDVVAEGEQVQTLIDLESFDPIAVPDDLAVALEALGADD
ncbi:acyl-CoA thioesterase [Halovivax gelatinilyticus]|uniref:acyl-CoA thioesterase n=1 Tax=Halovivax gelatinilyticus TaxID=2961597 RepID=UPI0020CA7A83|nr:thioesterase family protein [Halovivax gelatinilyticus]